LPGESKRETELVVGDFVVVARLGFGSERLRLFFTDNRIIAAHIGKRGAGAITGAMEDIFKRGKESVSQRGIEKHTASEILAMDRDNFEIKYGEVISGELVQGEFNTVIRLLTGNDKFEFRTGKSFDHVVALMRRFLGERIEVQRLSGTRSHVD
jgi:hypothetical protein